MTLLAKPITLVLGGGNALGGYQAGAYAELHRRGVMVDRIVGASAGAINGALIAGNPPERRIERLAAFWRPATEAPPPALQGRSLDTFRRTMATTRSLFGGNPRIFSPRADVLWQQGAGSPAPSLYDTQQLARTLNELIDFELLNDGSLRFCATAIDLESGEDVAFDTERCRVTAEHIRASSAMPPTYPPVMIDNRSFVDAGVSANLPVDPVLETLAEDAPVFCIAIDLLPLAAARPTTLGDAAGRAQDLTFACQSRRSLTAWQRVVDARVRGGEKLTATVVHLQYADQADEVAGKAMDYSPASAFARWTAGERDMALVLDRIASGDIRPATAGLTIETVATVSEVSNAA